MTAGGLRRRLVTGAVAMLSAGLLVGPGAVPLAAETTRPVELTITARRTAGKVAERITLHIQGTTVGTLAVGRRHPVAILRLKLPHPGRYAYTLSSTAVFELNGEAPPARRPRRRLNRGDRWATRRGLRRPASSGPRHDAGVSVAPLPQKTTRKATQASSERALPQQVARSPVSSAGGGGWSARRAARARPGPGWRRRPAAARGRPGPARR